MEKGEKSITGVKGSDSYSLVNVQYREVMKMSREGSLDVAWVI